MKYSKQVVEATRDEIAVLETNIDDATGEELGYVMERLFEEGARDVWYQSIFMKKNRPAYLLSVLCSVEDIERLSAVIFRETTSIGVRHVRMGRMVLPRSFENAEIDGEAYSLKVVQNGEESYAYPEYEDVVRYARSHDVSFREAYDVVHLAFLQQKQ